MEHNCTACASFEFIDDHGSIGWCMIGLVHRPLLADSYDGSRYVGSTCQNWSPRCRECGDPATHGWRAEVYCAACADELRRLSEGAHQFIPLQK